MLTLATAVCAGSGSLASTTNWKLENTIDNIKTPENEILPYPNNNIKIMINIVIIINTFKE